jgi:hypothetical protein
MAATTTYKAKLTYPQVFLWRMSLFLILAILLAIILDGQTQQLRTSFMANPGLNSLIIGVLFIGIVYSFRQVLRLYPEIRWVNSFRISDPGLAVDTTPVLLAPMATMLRDRTGHLSLATGAMRSLLDSVASRLDEQRETTRYLVGLLVFLGLLGTFWGLLQTVSSVGSTISALDTSGSESVMLFDQLKEGLAAPLKGMGTAFSCSMFGLSGSLILGFLDLQAGHAQNRFYNDLEDWLSGITELQSAEGATITGVPPQLRFALLDMQHSLSDLNEKIEPRVLGDNTGDAVKDLAQGAEKLIRQTLLDMQRSLSDLSEKIELRVLGDNTGDAVKDLAQGVEKLIRQMRAEQKVVREWADEQAQQQHELAVALKQITGKVKLPVHEEERS